MPGGWGGGPTAGAETERYDLFVTFAQADRAWVLGFMLPALGLADDRVITAEHFRPGASVVDEFERAVTTSRYTVVVVSNAYLADAWSVFAEQLTSYASVGGSDQLIPAVLESCELPLRVEFRVRLDMTDERRWEEQLARLRGLLEQSDPGMEELPCPYPGMQVFIQDQAQWFYGREDESEQMVRRVRGQSLVVVIGPSGAGKSSLVFAGLLPHLGAAGPDGMRWMVRSLRPGAHPSRELAVAIDVDNALPAKQAGDVVGTLLGRDGAERLLLVVDQLEEVFAQAARDEQAAFFDRLRVLRGDERCALLVTVRADFYAELMTCPLWPLGPGERFEVVPLAGAALARAIQQPAADVGVHLQLELVQRLVDDAAGEPGALPFVQETLVLLWRQRQRRLLTAAAYDRLGGEGRSALTAAIAEKADATVSALSPRERAIARRILLRLVQLGEGRQDTRRQEPVVALRSSAESPAEFEATLQHLTANRLLTLSGQEGDGSRVDLAHEALIAGWPQLHEWIRDNRDNLRMQRAVSEDAERWDELGRDPEALYRGARLEGAGVWADTHHDELNDLEREFVQASRTDASARQRRHRRTTLLLRGLSALVLVALTAVTFVSVRAADTQRRLADEQTLRAEDLARLAEESARRAEEAASRERLLAQAIAREGGAYGTEWVGDRMAFGANGTVLSYAEAQAPPGVLQAEVGLWDVSTGETRRLELGDADALATSIEFSADGDRVAWAHARGTAGQIVVYDLISNEQIGSPIERPDGLVFDLHFSQDAGSLRWFEVSSTAADIVSWDIDEQRRRNPVPPAGELRTIADHLEPLADRAPQRFLPRLSSDGELGAFRVFDPDLEDDLYVFWDVADSRPAGSKVTASGMLDSSDDSQYTDVVLVPGGQVAVIIPDYDQPFFWYPREGRHEEIFGLEGESTLSDPRLSRDGSTLLLCSMSWEVGSGTRWTVIDIAAAQAKSVAPILSDPPSESSHDGADVNTDCPIGVSDDGSEVAVISTTGPQYPEDEEMARSVVSVVSVHDARSGQQIGRSFTLQSRPGHETQALLNPNGTRHAIRVVSEEDADQAELIIWDASTGDRIN
jgi:hypothetical protein